MGTLHEVFYFTCVIISRCIFLRASNVSDISCRDNQNSHLCSITFSENHTFYAEKYGTVRQATDDNIVGCMRITYWIIKSTDTHSEFVIFITSEQQKS